MKGTFLIGRFLKAYISAYRYKKSYQPQNTDLTPEYLRKRFKQRERRFRAMNGHYTLTLQACTALAVLVVISAFHLDFRSVKTLDVTPITQELVTINEIIQTQQLVKPPPPPRPPIPVEVPNDEIIEDDDIDLDASLDIESPLVALGPPPPPEKEAKPETKEDEVFVVVEEMPEIVGGLAALSKDLVYPTLAQRSGIEGTVVVQVLIDKAGKPSNPVVAKSVHDVLDNAAVEAVLKQEFTPGRQRGRAVRTIMSIPVRFTLRDS